MGLSLNHSSHSSQLNTIICLSKCIRGTLPAVVVAAAARARARQRRLLHQRAICEHIIEGETNTFDKRLTRQLLCTRWPRSKCLKSNVGAGWCVRIIKNNDQSKQKAIEPNGNRSLRLRNLETIQPRIGATFMTNKCAHSFRNEIISNAARAFALTIIAPAVISRLCRRTRSRTRACTQLCLL